MRRLDDKARARVVQLRKQGLSLSAICKRMGIAMSTVASILKEAGEVNERATATT